MLTETWKLSYKNCLFYSTYHYVIQSGYGNLRSATIVHNISLIRAFSICGFAEYYYII